MKKIASLSLLALAIVVLVPAPSFAATRTVNLKPTSAEIGSALIYFNDTTTLGLTLGGGGSGLSNILQQDGQFVTLDPSIAGPGGSQSSSSLLVVNYEKNSICTGANIQSIKLHVVWKEEPQSVQNDDYAVLSETFLGEGDIRGFKGTLNTTTNESTPITVLYGGLLVSGITGLNPTYSGNAPTTLTDESAIVQTPLTLAQLNHNDTRIIISLGDQGPEIANTIGSVDYAYLEVTYDDTNCSPVGVDTTVVAAPKTGSALTVSIIVAAFVAAIGASLFGAKRTKLKHRNSERM